MIKKIIISFMLSIISTTIVVYPAQSNNILVKNNSKCTNAGSTISDSNFLYKCSKSKNSLTWKKIKRLSQNKIAKPIVSESNISVTTNPVSMSIWEKAFLSFSDWASDNKTTKNNHFVYKNDDIPEDLFLVINKAELLAKDIFGNIVKQDTYSYYGGEDLKWFDSNRHLPPGNAKENICNQPWADNLAACPNMSDALFYRAPHNDYNASDYFAPLGSHEYFHLVQSTLGGIPLNLDTRPFIWFMEGGAGFVGISIASLATNKPYDYFINDKDKIFYDINKDPYVSGRMFFEFVVAEYGFTSILNILSDYKTNRNFDQVFKNNTGYTVDQVLNKFKEVSNV